MTLTMQLCTDESLIGYHLSPPTTTPAGWMLGDHALPDAYEVASAQGMMHQTWRVLGDPSGYALLDPRDTVLHLYPLEDTTDTAGGVTYLRALTDMAVLAGLDVARED